MSFLGEMQIISSLANDYTDSHVGIRRKSHVFNGERKHLYRYAFEGLYRLYDSAKTLTDISVCEQTYENDGEVFSQLLDRSWEKLASTSDILGNAVSLSTRDRSSIAIKSILFCRGNVPLQYKQKLLETLGYKPQTIMNVAESAAWTAGLVLPGDLFLGVAQSIPLFFDPRVQLDSPGAKEIVAFAYIIDALALAYNTYQNVKDVHNPKLEACPNFFATSLYLLMKKLFPTHKSWQDLLVILPSIIPTIVSEAALYPLIYLPNVGVPITVTRNIFSAANQLVNERVARGMYRRAEFIKG